MNKVIIMQKLKSLDHLVSEHHSRFDCELPLAIIKKILQTWAKEIHDHSIVISLYSKPMD
jgi:hypothetical protein